MKTVFLAKKAYYMVRTPADLRDKVGNKIKPVYYSFEPTSFGFAYATDDENTIDWLKKQDHFAKGLIWIMDEQDAKVVQMGPQVVVGGTTSASHEPGSEPEAPRKGRKAKVSK